MAKDEKCKVERTLVPGPLDPLSGVGRWPRFLVTHICVSPDVCVSDRGFIRGLRLIHCRTDISPAVHGRPTDISSKSTASGVRSYKVKYDSLVKTRLEEIPAI